MPEHGEPCFHECAFWGRTQDRLGSRPVPVLHAVNVPPGQTAPFLWWFQNCEILLARWQMNVLHGKTIRADCYKSIPA